MNIKKQAYKKIKSSRAVTLTEMLFALLILSLSTAAAVGSVQLAQRHFITQTRESEAQLLCSALVTAIQGELIYAQEIDVADQTYFSSARKLGGECAITTYASTGRDSEGGTVTVSGNAGDDGEVVIVSNAGSSPVYYPLVEHEDYALGNNKGFLKAQLTQSWTKSGGAVDITMTVTVTDSSGNTLSESTFSVRPIAPGG